MAKYDFWVTYSSDALAFAQRIEICLPAAVLTQFFGLSAQDYPEIEPKWHCLASIEVRT